MKREIRLNSGVLKRTGKKREIAREERKRGKEEVCNAEEGRVMRGIYNKLIWMRGGIFVTSDTVMIIK